MIRFNDGVNVDTSGELRKLQLSDGLYVIGKGIMLPVDSDEEANEIILLAKSEFGVETEVFITYLPEVSST